MDNEYVEGLETVQKLLDFVFGLLTGSALTMGFLEAAKVIAEEAKRLAPVRTGNLRDSIQAIQEGFDVYVVAEATYAKFVEFGTKRMAARPFIRKALEATGDKALTALGRVLQDALDSKL